MRVYHFLTAALLLTAAAGLACPAPAAAMPGASGTDRFAAMDADSDGRVVREEFEKNMPQMRREAFDTIDLNKDGALTRAEWDAFRQNHGMQQGKQPQAPASPDAPAKKPLIQPPSNS